MQPYLEAIRRRVGSVCIDGVFENEPKFVRCGLPADQTCPIEMYLPRVVEVVESIESSRIEDYVAIVRDKVCASCQQNEEGVCDLRLKADCALDRYFMLVAEAIEEVQKQAPNSTNKRADDWFIPTPW